MYAGTQLWKVLFHLVKPGVRLDYNDISDIGQIDAIRTWIGRRPPKQHQRLLQGDNSTKRNLGLAAVLSLGIPFSLNIFLLFALSGFGVNPIVTTWSTSACAISIDGGLQFRKAWTAAAIHIQACLMPENERSSPCWNSIVSSSRPSIEVDEIPCPFQSAACLSEQNSFSLSYNLSLSMLNLNIPNNVSITMRHRLLYSHLHLVPFMRVGIRHNDLYFSDDTYIKDGSYLQGFFSRPLWTLNGPNEYSNDFSGGISNVHKYIHLPSVHLEITPGFHLNTDEDSRLYTHPLLKIDSATPFQLVLFHGFTLYNSTKPITDPFFRAIRPIRELSPSIYTPDYEATGLALAEQYQFCIASNQVNDQTEECSKWQSNRWSPLGTPPSDTEEEIDPSLLILSRFESQSFPELLRTELRTNHAVRRALFTAFTYSSIEESFRENTQLPLSKTFVNVRLSPVIDPHNQTLHELKTSVEIVILKVLYAMLYSVQGEIPGLDCGAPLFVNPNYSNFNSIASFFVFIIFGLIILLSWWFDAYEAWNDPWFQKFREATRSLFGAAGIITDDMLQLMRRGSRNLRF
jgi:hypothetical protein